MQNKDHINQDHINQNHINQENINQEINTNKTPITFEEIARALAEDYVSLFVIDSGDNSYVEYLAEGEPKKLVQRASGDDFFQDVIRDAKEQVFPEDQGFFLESFKKENVIDILKTGKSFSLNYRIIVDGEVLHYFWFNHKFCVMADSGHTPSDSHP